MPVLLPATDVTERSCWALDHWFRRCQGFQVWDATEQIGSVEAVLTDDDDRPHSLIVRVGTGSVFSVLVTFPADAVDGFDPASERVFVTTTAPGETAIRQLRLPGVA